MTSLPASSPPRAVLLLAPSLREVARAHPRSSRAAAVRAQKLLLENALAALRPLSPDIALFLVSDRAREMAEKAQEELPGRAVHPLPLVGSTPRQRQKKALQAARRLGARQVVLLDARAPALRACHILEALARAAQASLVLGPAVPEGFYLLAGDVTRCLQRLSEGEGQGAPLPADTPSSLLVPLPLWSGVSLGAAPKAVLQRLLRGAGRLAQALLSLVRSYDAALAEAFSPPRLLVFGAALPVRGPPLAV